MSRAGSQYGLTSDTGQEWSMRVACAGHDPAMWEVGKRLSDKNREALGICSRCPVRTECRDDMLALDRPKSIIAGGWRWTGAGRPIPALGEKGLVPAPPPPPASAPTAGRPRRAAGVDVDHYLAAGQALVAGRSGVRQVCRTFGLSVRRVYAAAMVTRWAPDMLTDLADRTVSIPDAEDLARVRQRRAMDAGRAA